MYLHTKRTKKSENWKRTLRTRWLYGMEGKMSRDSEARAEVLVSGVDKPQEEEKN